MEEAKELKSVLERVEGKLIAAGKIYGAMNFAIWLVVMSLFFVLFGVFNINILISVAYWGVAMLIGVYASVKLWERIKRLGGTPKGGRAGALGIGLSWAIGSLIGWWVIPSITEIGVSEDSRLAVGFLAFIGLSLLGQWLVMTRGKSEYEMVPSFLIPFLTIPVVIGMKNWAMTWAGFVVAFSYGLTVLLYLYSAFKAIER
ncbi:hypothetical protein [Thermococcus sp.]|uniref:hypothetical protein n=1 Tax=Thermococcus sp. TaxID=35749 RepID=UPI00261604C5|nr:hypothetical protein [Thermococcus sp.]